MVNEFKLTVVHFARHNPMQICAKKLWKIRTGSPGFRASGPRAVMGRGPRAAGPSWAVGRGKLAGGLLLAKPHNNCHRIHKRDISTKYRHVQIFLWIFASIGLQCHYFAFGGFYASRMQDAEVNKVTAYFFVWTMKCTQWKYWIYSLWLSLLQKLHCI